MTWRRQTKTSGQCDHILQSSARTSESSRLSLQPLAQRAHRLRPDTRRGADAWQIAVDELRDFQLEHLPDLHDVRQVFPVHVLLQHQIEVNDLLQESRDIVLRSDKPLTPRQIRCCCENVRRSTRVTGHTRANAHRWHLRAD